MLAPCILRQALHRGGLVARATLTLALMLGGYSSAGAQSAAPAQPTAEIVLAGEDDWPPYSSASTAEPQAAPVGFAVDLVRAVFASQGLTVKIISVPFARCMLYAKTGQVAGCFNATITDDNRGDYVWHQPAMFEEELSIYGRVEETASEMRLSDLRGKRVAYTNGYTYPSEFMHDSRIQKFSAVSDTALIRMLLSRRVDYILLNRTPGSMRIDNTPEFRGRVRRTGIVSMDGFWLAFSKQHPQGERLALQFGQGLSQMRRDGSYQRMLDEFRSRVGYR
ncbi:substrate-binding periplasmic protein [Roseateles sp.]|jgi:polar amino acid transport system substrate-binding protein|uniref:substrate-binding periplasmic protein n=1 Tax=Roseateles sp. TaxID=1971397 RepID=UPI00391D51A4